MDKQKIRSEIARRKQVYTLTERLILSERAIKRVEALTLFRSARTILLYHSLPDEVYTHDWITRLAKEKEVWLPVVKGDVLEVVAYRSEEAMRQGAYHIWEPQGVALTDLSTLDLAIVPGVSFDRWGTRLGRGKGYYDRLLSSASMPTIGLCFQFQLWEGQLPRASWDQPMQRVVTDQEDIIPIF